jgi:hypothetical protein
MGPRDGDERDVERVAAGQRVGAAAGGAAVLEDPRGDARPAVLLDEGRRRPGRRRELAVRAGHEDRDVAAEDVGELLQRHVQERHRAGSAREVAAHPEQRLGAPLALARRDGLLAHAHGERRDEQADAEHDPEGDQVLGVRDGEGEPRGHEEEVEEQHAGHRGGHGGPASVARRDEGHAEQVDHDQVGLDQPGPRHPGRRQAGGRDDERGPPVRAPDRRLLVARARVAARGGGGLPALGVVLVVVAGLHDLHADPAPLLQELGRSSSRRASAASAAPTARPRRSASRCASAHRPRSPRPRPSPRA